MEDLLLDNDGNFMVGANGDALTATGYQEKQQYVQNELLTYPGDLWTHEEYGAGLQRFIHSEDSEINRDDMIYEIQSKLNENIAVIPGSVEVEITSWTSEAIRMKVTFLSADDPEEDTAPEVVLTVILNKAGISMEGG